MSKCDLVSSFDADNFAHAAANAGQDMALAHDHSIPRIDFLDKK